MSDFVKTQWLESAYRMALHPTEAMWEDIEDAYAPSFLRRYHTMDHIEAVIKRMIETRESHGIKDDSFDYHLGILAAVYHDFIYDFSKSSPYNELSSALIAKINYLRMIDSFDKDEHLPELEVIDRAIMATADHGDVAAHPENYSDVTRWLVDADMSIFLQDLDTYKAYAENIMGEYGGLSRPYVHGRRAFLQRIRDSKRVFTVEPSAHEQTRMVENLKYELEMLDRLEPTIPLTASEIMKAKLLARQAEQK